MVDVAWVVIVVVVENLLKHPKHYSSSYRMCACDFGVLEECRRVFRRCRICFVSYLWIVVASVVDEIVVIVGW